MNKNVIPNLSLTARLSLFSSLALVVKGYRVPVYEALSQGFQYSDRARQERTTESERLTNRTSEQDALEKELQFFAKRLLRKNRAALRAHNKRVLPKKGRSSRKRNNSRGGKKKERGI